MSGSKRVEWIDVAKGVGIVLVSFGHLRNGDGESVWLPALDAPIDAIYLFHMPLFFLLGGLTFSRRGGFKAFLVRKAKTLLVPYYVFSLYFLAKPFAILLIPSMRAAFQTSHDYGIAHQFLDVLVMGNGLWFLMAFFVGECLMYGLTSLTDNGRVLAAIGMASVILSTFVSSQTGWPTLPFQIVAGVKAAGYMCVGYVLKEWLKAIPRGRAGVSSACAAIVFLTLAVPAVAGIVPDGPALLTASVAAAFLGTFAVIWLCIAVGSCRMLPYIGRYSLVYYALNALTLNIMKIGLFRVIGIDVASAPWFSQLLAGLAATALALVILTIANLFVQRWMWWAIGKNAHNPVVPERLRTFGHVRP